ncbi:MAG: [FeFe] hydrogenase H-cluster maturation GTPase HydF [Acetobacter sp.]|nr:[FeFe] hydrogenase H-cluster maturation GTPase HydF [Acetobacter sp.]
MTKVLPHSGMRTTVAIVGNRNAGKSTLLNRITGQEVSIVSETLGTTTDAVIKTYELIPAGPISFYDTAGLDDEGELGRLRVRASEKILNRADMVLVVIGKDGITPDIDRRLKEFEQKEIPFIPVFNYADLSEPTGYDKIIMEKYQGVTVSAKTGIGIDALKSRIAALLTPETSPKPLLDGLIQTGDIVILVTPIDTAAPKGRLIMPQTQTLREVLDMNALALTVQTSELPAALAALKTPPALVITDSQAIKEVAALTPKEIKLTTFSMLLAKNKGDFKKMLAGAYAIDELKDGDKILIAEGCSHRQTCDDIGRVKIPNLLQKHTGKQLSFAFTAGNDFPDNLTDYALVIHCGGCVLTRPEIRRRLNECTRQEVKVTNYGMLISHCQGVLPRTASPLLP